MKWIKNLFYSRRVFVRLFVLTMAFSVVPAIGGGLVYFNRVSQRLTTEYIKNNRALLLQAVNAFDLVIDTVVESTHLIYSDTAFMNLLGDGESLDQIDRGRVLDRLLQMRDSGKYIDSVTLYLNNGGLVFDTSYGFCRLPDFPDRQWLDLHRENQRQMVLVDRRILARSNHERNPAYSVISFILQMPLGGTRPIGSLVVNIDPDKVYDGVIKKLKTGDDNELFVASKNGEIVVSDARSGLLQKIRDEGRLDRLLNGAGESPSIEIDGTKYLDISLPSVLFNWEFHWLNSFDVVDRTIRSIRSFVVLGTVALLALIITLGMLVIQRLTGPIDELISSAGLRSRIAGSNPFKAVSSYVYDVMQRNGQLQSRLEKAMPLYEERFLHSLLTSNELGRVEVEARLREFDLALYTDFHSVMSFEMLNSYELSAGNTRMNVLKLGVDELFRIQFKQSRIHGFIVHINDDTIAVIINLRGEQLRAPKIHLHDFAQRVCRQIDQKYRLRLAVGTSSVGNGFDKLNGLYTESRQALWFRTINRDNQIIFIDEVSGVQSKFKKHLALEVDESFLNSLISGDQLAASTALTRMLSKLNTETNVSSREFKNFVFQLFAMISDLSLRLNIEMGGSGLHQLLTEIKTVRAAELFFLGLVESFCSAAHKTRRDLEIHYLKRITDCIDESFRDRLFCMDVLSEKANLSPSYIYKILKENLNKTFIDYLTERRLEEACKLLETRAKVQEVAAAVGYSSAKYFIKVFKSHKGYTPSKYQIIRV